MHLSPSTDLVKGLIGGALVGVSASGLMLLLGRTLGVSGITKTFVSDDLAKRHPLASFRGSFLAGLLAAGFGWRLVDPSVFGTGASSLGALSPALSVAAGSLVGFGSALGGGCTSGHGVCGLARLSMRSLVAVCTFMGTGAVTAFLARSAVEAAAKSASSSVSPSTPAEALSYALPVVAAVSAAAYVVNLIKRNKHHHHHHHHHHAHKDKAGGADACPAAAPAAPLQSSSPAARVVGAATALVFGAGLGAAGMTNPGVVRAFLDFSRPGGWDATLMGVMGAAVVLNMVVFNWLGRARAGAVPPVAETPAGSSAPYGAVLKLGACADNTKLTWQLVAGAALFGVGWGLGGVCPGPALVALGGGAAGAPLFVAAMVAGFGVHEAAAAAGVL